MKTRLVIIAILLLILTVLLTRNDERVSDMLLRVINPIKQNYQNLRQNITSKSQSYLFQEESIEKLDRENIILRKRLLEQTHYIKQVKDIYEILPQLKRFPTHTISITETISYVKLNSFSQIILTKPKGILDNRLYGLIQKDVVAGIAQIKNNQLYGYLTADKKCRFSVFIGENNAPGIAEGLEQNKMIIKFIPKWQNIKAGDKVVTSGLDAIFFENIPVGVVERVELLSSYKVAYIKTYSDIFHPKTFFLINNASVGIAKNFDSNETQLNSIYYTKGNSDINTSKDVNHTKPVISSIPQRIDQTQDDVIDPEAPSEEKELEKKIANKPQPDKTKPKVDKLDLF